MSHDYSVLDTMAAPSHDLLLLSYVSIKSTYHCTFVHLVFNDFLHELLSIFTVKSRLLAETYCAVQNGQSKSGYLINRFWYRVYKHLSDLHMS